MNKEFVSYKLALELKELGFDEPCLAYRDCDWNFIFSHNKNTFLECELPLPLYQQAFRFFREKYGLDCFIDRGGIKGIYHAFVGGSEHGFLYGNNRNSPSEFTYEEAELACLEKLIEIVKENKK